MIKLKYIKFFLKENLDRKNNGVLGDLNERSINKNEDSFFSILLILIKI